MAKKQTHTAGPWSASQGLDAEEFEVTARDGFTDVAQMIGNEADALLIAAAPELLAALRHAQECIYGTNFALFEVGGKTLGDAIRAAIRKAEGR